VVVSEPSATAFADHDTIRPHAKCVFYQIANRVLAFAFEVGRPCLKRDYVRLPQLKLRRIFDRHDALVSGDSRREHVEQGRLAAARPARDDDVLTDLHGIF
jgi:hypothetical protein